MDPNLLLSKCVTLLYRESQIENLTETSSNLVKTAVEKIVLNDKSVGLVTRKDVTAGLKAMVLEMCKNGADHIYDIVALLQQVRLIANGDEALVSAIQQSTEPELQQSAIKRTVTNLKKTVANFYRDARIKEVVMRASNEITFRPQKIENLTDYIRNHISELEVCLTKSSGKDPAIIASMNLSDPNSTREVFKSVNSSNSPELPFNTGWVELNNALQGGPRPGDTVVIGAVQHSYKTGFSLSLFANIARFNKPKTQDPNKIPMMYRISFEDPLRNNAQFIYQMLKYEETGEKVEVKGKDPDEIAEYVTKELERTGYRVLFEQVDPTKWTYQSIINRIVELESEGFQVEVLGLDYLMKVPTTGCTMGSLGDDVMDQLSRIRSFCSANNILMITPHQLSTDAKRVRSTLPVGQFLPFIKSGGFFERTKGLDRVYDIGILIDKCETPFGDFLHVLLDKHRFPTPIDNVATSFFLEFPPCKMPILPTYGKEGHKIIRKLPKHALNKDEALFI